MAEKKAKLMKEINAKRKQKKNKDEDGESWESVEEDAPAIKLGELLENMKINDDDESGDDDGDEDSGEERKTDN